MLHFNVILDDDRQPISDWVSLHPNIAILQPNNVSLRKTTYKIHKNVFTLGRLK